MMNNFTLENWELEKLEIQNQCHHSILGSCITPCPNCKQVGFYSCRKAKERKYRACKFCGFWQEVNGEPYRCYMVFCKKCNLFDWRKPDSEIGECVKCGGPQGKIDWPIDNHEHLFWKTAMVIADRHGEYLDKTRHITRDVIIACFFVLLPWLIFVLLSPRL